MLDHVKRYQQHKQYLDLPWGVNRQIRTPHTPHKLQESRQPSITNRVYVVVDAHLDLLSHDAKLLEGTPYVDDEHDA